MGGDGIGPMAGPAYRFDRRSPSRFKWPRYYNGVPLFYEWSRDYIKEFRLNRPNGRTLEDIRHVPVPVDNPMDMEFGPDGALYVLEYGDGFFSENPEAQLARIDFVRGNYTPVPVVTADVTQGLAPVTVNFTSAGTTDPDGDPIAYDVGLQRGRRGRLHGAEPDVHVHRERRVRRDAAGDRPYRPLGGRFASRSSSATWRRWSS